MPSYSFPTQLISTKDGIQLRTAVFEPRNKTTQKVCVLLHGRTEFIEKYAEIIAELCTRGYVVATFDWRGQGASTRALLDPLVQHVDDFSDYDEDLDAFMEQIVAPLQVEPVLVLAHSMGSNIALRALHRMPRAFRGAVLSAPMIEIRKEKILTLASSIMTKMGKSQKPILSNKSSDPLNAPFAGNFLTSDLNRYNRTLGILSEHPELRIAAPTWGWMKAAIESMKQVRASGFPEGIRLPVLICGAADDQICLTKAAENFAARLPIGNFVEFEKSKHEILMENDAIRTRFWKAFDDFVERP